MLTALHALAPVFIVIALGWTLRQFDFPGDALWPPLDRLTYYVFFPALLLYTLATADLSGLEVWPMAWAAWGGILSMVMLLMLLRLIPRITPDGPAFSSVFQGAVRWNGFVALAAIAQLWGPDGVALAAVAFATLVPAANILSVLVLTRYAGDRPAGARVILGLLSKNPLILACIAGGLLNVSGAGLPGPLKPTAEILGNAALTIGLLAVGAGLKPREAVQKKGIVLVTSLLKLLVMPAFMFGWCLVFDVGGLQRSVLLICGAVPGATSSYILARQLGGDATLMASLITGSTLFAILTIPLLLWMGV